MQELASGKGKHPVSSFIFACSYMGTFLSLPMFSTLPLFTLPFSFMLHVFFSFFPLSSAAGLLAVCHLKEHQVPFSGRLYLAKHRGMEAVQTLFLSHTQIYACTCTLLGQPNVNKSVIQLKQTSDKLHICTNLASALPCHSTELLTS